MTDINKMSLAERLEEYSHQDIYPFHMPGHKRRYPLPMGSAIDITEIDGFDDLHHPEEILLESQQRAAIVRHAKESYFLVNGSTCGLLAAIFAAAQPGESIAIARNCHKSVYHAAMIRGLCTHYLYPKSTTLGINGAVLAEDVDKLLREHGSMRAVVITSPTYDGVVSDVNAIADIVHSYGARLIVDSAHGAHLGIDMRLPKSAIECGADYVIESLHKTLPCYTQTAIIHSNLDDNASLREYLRVFMTSSPSYVFMAAIDNCIRYLENEAADDMDRVIGYIEKFHEQTAGLKHLHLLTKGEIVPEYGYDYDITKIVISTMNSELNGHDLHQKLLKDYNIQMEMAAGDFCLGIASVMDEQAGFERLGTALKEIDEELSGGEGIYLGKSYGAIKKYEIYEADAMNGSKMLIEDACGRAAAEYIYLYPPGSPIIVPGEIIEQQHIDMVISAKKMGLSVQGMDDLDAEYIKVI